ncbi:MAG: prepilin peptidase [Butyrivibrio sp.]|nr:prepilin peptidase [Butyrivibrio sp.]
MAEQIYEIICISLFGLVFGSFLNCMAMRMVRKEDYVKGRSHCMSCGHELGPRDLIPVFSYVSSGGRCRYCKEKISLRYPITEISFMVLSDVLYICTRPDGIMFYKNWVLVGLLFAIALVDLEAFEVPNELLLAAFISWAAFSVIELILGRNNLLYYGKQLLAGLILGAVMLLLSLLMDSILKRDSLGGGDIKLYAVLGVYLGFAGAYELVLLSCIFGLIFALIRKMISRNASKEFPFGPSIASAAYLVLLFGDAITAWYFKLL